MSLPIHRRHFLKSSLVAGSTVGLLKNSSPAGEFVSANDTIILAVLGLNNRGLNHASDISQLPGVEIAYVCDVDERVIPRCIEVVAKNQKRKPKGVADFRKILDDKTVDAVTIAMPNHWHSAATILSCAAGKHVYVEKPCSQTAEEGEMMVLEAQKHDRVVHMGNQRRSCPFYIEAVSKLHAGVIGNVLLARTWYNNRRESIGIGKVTTPPKELDFLLWQGPAPERPYMDNLVHYNWHWNWHWGNGELGNNGVHFIDVARWGLGVDYPTQVSSTGGRIRYDDDQQTPDTQLVTYSFGKRMITWEGLSWSPYGPSGSRFGITFHGDQGTMLLDSSGYTIFDLQNNQVGKFHGKCHDSDHYSNFLSCIRSGDRPTADIEEGHKSSLLCHLGNISHRVGRPIETNSQNGHIIGDTEAQALWTREYRQGWELDDIML
ncbi:Gfo/Idh/MocA family protein [Bythopirellula goksoeyrii]|uniref:Alpha-N-acetylgalactosaminidase n=1 Tax=Bythopirellula goksoeyrii TaxID=1400387 RepID=A0A5B9QBJ3_9BACT|nr:Gfo/Idh/MocA family oxidoreductase [Bythopirellula goksoeyrii]QEG36308.1 Alpha-N-acetylgalactosaminidase [Bythopirellula goksoeyrii]